MRALLLSVFLAAGVCLLAQEGPPGPQPEKAKQQPKSDWSDVMDGARIKKWMFKYVDREQLYADIEKYVGEYVRFVDELSVVWDKAAEYNYPSTRYEEPGKKKEREEVVAKGHKGDCDNQEFMDDGFLRFETSFFTCLLDISRKVPGDEKMPTLKNFAGRSYAQFLLGYNAFKRSSELPKETGEEPPDDEALRDKFLPDWHRRRHPKLVYVYGKVVRVVKFGRQTVVGEEKMTREEANDARAQAYLQGAPGEELIVIEVACVEPVVKAYHLRQVETRNEEYRRYMQQLKVRYSEPRLDLHRVPQERPPAPAEPTLKPPEPAPKPVEPAPKPVEPAPKPPEPAPAPPEPAPAPPEPPPVPPEQP